jgi:hypothetical protein
MMGQWLLVIVLLAAKGGKATVSLDADRALAIDREVVRIAHQQKLWPGFDPIGIPLAVFDGRRTYLFRHPAPPDGFSPLPGSKPVAHVFEGRHPDVTSNSSITLGGQVTATVRADGDTERSPTEAAAVALHESFHVFQRAKHPRWQGNEGDLVLYPADNARLLALRRQESEAFRRAMGLDGLESRCWATWALRYRRERYAAMDSVFSQYEWRSELNEGLARYIQERAMNHDLVEFPPAEFAPAEVRHRSYVSGATMAFLLDRLDPDWRDKLEADDQKNLHELLYQALGGTYADPPGMCRLTPEEVAKIETQAKQDAAAVTAARSRRRAEFDAAPGWRVEVSAADGAPLWPQGFDPLNIERIDDGLLHTRFLKLGNDAGELSMVDEQGADLQSRTEGVGPHPLFQGVRHVVVVVPGKPSVDDQSGEVTIRAPGISAHFKNARLTATDQLIQIQLVRE